MAGNSLALEASRSHPHSHSRCHMLRASRLKYHGAALARASCLMTRKRALGGGSAAAGGKAKRGAAAGQAASPRKAAAPRGLESVPASQAAGADALEVLRYEALVPGLLQRRYKRFLGDVQLVPGGGEWQQQEGGAEPTVVHVPNTGPMTGLLDALPARVLLSASSNAKRKYAHTLEWIQPQAGGTWVGVHSAKANAMARHLLQHRLIPGLPPYSALLPEVKYGSDGKSRVDFVLHGDVGAMTHMEVKSVTLAEDTPEGTRIALFPDTVSDRAQRHVRELTALATAGGAAALVFVVQRGDCSAFAPCHEKDPTYARLVREAAAAGVVLAAVVCRLDPEAGVVRFGGPLPVRLDYRVPG